jgi:hypothetical protein
MEAAGTRPTLTAPLTASPRRSAEERRRPRTACPRGLRDHASACTGVSRGPQAPGVDCQSMRAGHDHPRPVTLRAAPYATIGG